MHSLPKQQREMEEELIKRLSHQSLGASDESDSEESQPPPSLYTSSPSSHPHTIPTSQPPQPPHPPMVDPSGDLSVQLPDGVQRRERRQRQIRLQRGKCLGVCLLSLHLYSSRILWYMNI